MIFSFPVISKSKVLKFMFFKKATKIDEIFTVDLTLCSKCQIDGEDFVSFRGFLRKYELYKQLLSSTAFKFSNFSLYFPSSC